MRRCSIDTGWAQGSLKAAVCRLANDAWCMTQQPACQGCSALLWPAAKADTQRVTHQPSAVGSYGHYSWPPHQWRGHGEGEGAHAGLCRAHPAEQLPLQH